MVWRPSLATVALALLGACTAPVPPPVIELAPPVEEEDWRAVASPQDLARIEALPEIWTEALAGARAGGYSRRAQSEGELLQPDAALPRPALPPGSYRCRILRFEGERFTAYRRFFCHVGAEGRLDSLTKQTGTERPGGYLWPDDGRRIFLGAMAAGEDEVPPAYGEDPERDLAGVVERVGPFLWRLVLPRESGLDVIELIPALPPED